MSNAIAGPGFLIQKGDGGGPEAFTTVAEVLDINGPNLKTDTVDVTNQSSPGSVEEVIATIKRTGEVTWDMNFLPGDATQNASTGVLADWISRVLRNWKLLNNDTGATKWTFAAFVTGYAPKYPVAGVAKASVTLKLSGVPTLA